MPADPLVCGHPKSQHALQQAMTECGPTLDFTPVNSYAGPFAEVLNSTEDAVALVDGDCTGSLIQASSGPVILTAGHCVGLDDRVVVTFNYEDNPDGDQLVTEGTVFEQSDEPDYALIRLDQLPAIQPLLLTSRPDERLAIVQHPQGLPKVVAEGWYEDSCDSLVYYSDLDTQVGSSGAGVLNRAGHLLGIHTDGDCELNWHGTNRGYTSQSIVDASPYLEPGDIADR